jgi:hypothetical protein
MDIDLPTYDLNFVTAEDEVEMGHHGTIPNGRGRSTMTRPTT